MLFIENLNCNESAVCIGTKLLLGEMSSTNVNFCIKTFVGGNETCVTEKNEFAYAVKSIKVNTC